jgi:hypothetical protein
MNLSRKIRNLQGREGERERERGEAVSESTITLSATGMEYLLATRNKKHPMEITTHYGAYMTVQNVLRNFDNAIVKWLGGRP